MVRDAPRFVRQKEIIMRGLLIIPIGFLLDFEGKHS